MRTVLLGLCFAFVAATASAAVEGGLVKAGEFHNVHIRVPDPAKAGEWYVKSLGATAGRAPQLIFFGKTLIEFLKDEAAKPSAGSVIDHIGLSYADLDEQMKVLSANGAKIVTPVRDVPGLFKLGFIEDPWGTKIEVVQDMEQLGFHHVHLSVPDPPNVLSWYQDAFGGERTKLKDRIDGLRYGGVWLLAAASAAGEEPASSAGHAIYNLAWTVPSVDDAVAALRAKGLKVTVEPRSLPTVRYAFVEDPNGILIEFIETLKP
jgi:catechol 2,3-dioxygenase-like lactoylglutathione lyase family enzyme